VTRSAFYAGGGRFERIVFAAGLLIVLGLASACGLAGSADSQGEVAQRGAGAALLTADDLPGWTQDTGGGGADLDVQLSPACDILKAQTAFAGASATAESPVFDGPDEQQVRSFSGVYASQEAAARAISGIAAKVDGCRNEFKQALRAIAERRLDAAGVSLGRLGNIDVSVEDGSPPARGQDGRRYRIGVDVSVLGFHRQFRADFLLLREGQTAGALMYDRYGDLDEGEEAAITGRLDGRFQQADAIARQ